MNVRLRSTRNDPQYPYGLRLTHVASLLDLGTHLQVTFSRRCDSHGCTYPDFDRFGSKLTYNGGKHDHPAGTRYYHYSMAVESIWADGEKEPTRTPVDPEMDAYARAGGNMD
jgi:hypothetical protein